MNDNFLCGSLFALIAAVTLVAGAPDSHSEPFWGAELPPTAHVVVMPTVQVIGKHLPEFASAPEVVHLPMVTVTGRREMTQESVALARTH